MACLNFTLYLNSTFPRNLWRNDIRSITNLFQQFKVGDYSIEIVHLADEPRRGFHDGVFTTPTILVEQENGRRQLIGDLADTERYLSLLQYSEPAIETQDTRSAVVTTQPRAARTLSELILANLPFEGAGTR